jgi:hypothetical protein
MKYYGKLAGLLIGTALVAACSSITTSADYDQSTDFSKYRTYAWKDVEPMQNQLAEARIKAAVDRALASKGLRNVESDSDLWVVPHARLSKETQISTYNSGWGYGGWGGYGWGARGGGMGMSTSTVNEIPVGNLIIDLVDASKKQMVWRGQASKTLDPSASPETKQKNVDEAVQKMFAGYPPGASK